MINLPTKILLAIKPMRTQFKFTLRLICTPEYKYTPEYIYTRVFFAHANWTYAFYQSFCTTMYLSIGPDQHADLESHSHVQVFVSSAYARIMLLSITTHCQGIFHHQTLAQTLDPLKEIWTVSSENKIFCIC